MPKLERRSEGVRHHGVREGRAHDSLGPLGQHRGSPKAIDIFDQVPGEQLPVETGLVRRPPHIVERDEASFFDGRIRKSSGC
jgi:hypothetical protein